MVNSNTLSERYATKEMNHIFSERTRIRMEHQLWITVMEAQRELGIAIPADDIAKYKEVIDDIDPEAIRQRELKLKHDVKARIETFVTAAGATECIHLGMTSRDLTDNVEQMQFRDASQLIFGKYVSVLRHLIDKAAQYRDTIIAARTHYKPAQPTRLGRRFASWAEELLFHLQDFETFIERYPLRGMKGAVGTQSDMLTLLGSAEKVYKLEKIVADKLGFGTVLNAPGQIYPRSLDYKLLSHLSFMSAACESFATTMRLMAGADLVSEGFGEMQTGSTAMPHKMNPRSCERVCSFASLLKMYTDGASRISGAQWNEGDVSCSATRRTVMPDAFYTSDGLCETTLTVLNEMEVYQPVINAELDRYLPFMASTELLLLATSKGIGREMAHKIIKHHSVSEAQRVMREGGDTNNIAYALADDPLFKKHDITYDDIHEAINRRKQMTGTARMQIESVTADVSTMLRKYQTEATYEPQAIL